MIKNKILNIKYKNKFKILKIIKNILGYFCSINYQRKVFNSCSKKLF